MTGHIKILVLLVCYDTKSLQMLIKVSSFHLQSMELASTHTQLIRAWITNGFIFNIFHFFLITPYTIMLSCATFSQLAFSSTLSLQTAEKFRCSVCHYTRRHLNPADHWIDSLVMIKRHQWLNIIHFNVYDIIAHCSIDWNVRLSHWYDYLGMIQLADL